MEPNRSRSGAETELNGAEMDRNQAFRGRPGGFYRGGGGVGSCKGKKKISMLGGHFGDIYIYAVESKPGPRFALFLSQSLVQVFSFFLSFFVFQKSSSFCRENEILKKNKQEKDKTKHHFLSQNLVQLCCATYLDQVLTQPWTRF